MENAVTKFVLLTFLVKVLFHGYSLGYLNAFLLSSQDQEKVSIGLVKDTVFQ